MSIGDDIIIRLIRSEIKENDDVIKIRRRLHHHQSFLLRYTDGLVINKVWINDKTIIELMKYLENLFLCLSYDNDPFIKLQISIASYPIIFIKIDEEFKEDLKYSLLGIIYDELIKPAAYFTR
jgi:hypothetical protein|uniref:Uncharacterized protein n=1 Tax=viral metagenome TaxID=1070528 RepID=A0A6C0LC81_9ZZZZ